MGINNQTAIEKLCFYLKMLHENRGHVKPTLKDTLPQEIWPMLLFLVTARMLHYKLKIEQPIENK